MLPGSKTMCLFVSHKVGEVVFERQLGFRLCAHRSQLFLYIDNRARATIETVPLGLANVRT